MSSLTFLSDIRPLWNHSTARGEIDCEELAGVSEQHNYKAWTTVKLPSIPIELSEELSPTRPCSRDVRTALATKRASTENSCLFCGNKACRANHIAATSEHDHEKSRKLRTRGTARRQKSDSKLDVRKKGVLFGSLGVAPSEISPRSLLEPIVRVKSACSRSNSRGDTTERASGWEPFSCKCQYCGTRFGKHSVGVHERRCSKRHQPLPSSTFTPKHSTKPQKVPHEISFSNTLNSEMSRKVATIVTVGLNSRMVEKSTVYAPLPPRPQTRTLCHSSLRSGGYGIPLAAHEYKKFQETSSSMQCGQCQQIVAADRISVHRVLCKPSVPTVSPCAVIFSPIQNSLCVDENPVNSENSELQKPRKPPTKVCYICKREFGSHSIAIHEPQCLRKWHTENRKLPVNERKSVPKKPESKPAIAKTISVGDTSIKSDNLLDKNKGFKEKLVQRYFENCYSEFKKDLVSCKKCGRTFAPDRHKLHEQNCNAKPINRTTSRKQDE